MKLVFLLLCASLSWSAVIDSGSSADQFFTGGAAWTVTTPALIDTTLRYGTAFSYRIPATGDVTITLRFLEPTVTAIGQRVFSVSINGLTVVSGLDLVAVAGFLQPYSRTFQASQRNGFVDIAFTAQVRSAVVSSIEITPIVSPALVAVGVGLVSTVLDGKQTLSVDTAHVLHLGQDAGLPLPVAGDVCSVSGAVVVGPDAVYFCAAVLPLSTNPALWGKWIRIAAAPAVLVYQHPSGLLRVDVGSLSVTGESTLPEWRAAGWTLR